MKSISGRNEEIPWLVEFVLSVHLLPYFNSSTQPPLISHTVYPASWMKNPPGQVRLFCNGKVSKNPGSQDFIPSLTCEQPNLPLVETSV